MRLLIFNLKTDADDDVLGFTTDWINGLAVHCERVFVITMTCGRMAVAANVEVLSVGKERGYSELRRTFEFYRLLSNLLRHERIDACFAHMMPLFAVMGWPLLRIYRVPIVLWYAHSHVSWMVRVATRLVDRVVTSTRSGFQLPTRKLSIIGQGVDVARFRPAETETILPDRFVLLTVGRISPVKRLEVLIDAISGLPERRSDGRRIVVRFVGNPLTSRDVEYLTMLRRRVESAGVADRVEFSSACAFTQIDHTYREADLFVNSSDTDSVDKTVLEAMSTGLPVVTSNAAFVDIFDREYAALCQVPKGDVPALANRLQRLIEMPGDERRALGSALRATVRRDHSLEALCSRVIKVLGGC
jgi:glycosyltransferase involved in cell wall biosynthesis